MACREIAICSAMNGDTYINTREAMISVWARQYSISMLQSPLQSQYLLNSRMRGNSARLKTTVAPLADQNKTIDCWTWKV